VLANRSGNRRDLGAGRGCPESPGGANKLKSRVRSGIPQNRQSRKNLLSEMGSPVCRQVAVKGNMKRKRRWRLASELVLLLCFAVILIVKLELIDLNSVKAGILSRVTSIYPDKDGAYAFLGRHYTSCGRPKEAIKACVTLVGMKPNDPSAHVLLGNAYREANLPQKAIESYKEAIRLDPNSFDARLGLGETYSGLRRHAEAIDFLKQAIRIKPDSAYAHLSLGLALSNSGRYDEAMKAFRQAKELDPDIAEVHVLSGKAYLQAGLYERAVECFKDVILTDQRHAQAQFSLGRAYLRIGDQALALKQQRILEELDPKLAQDLSELIKSN